MATQRKQYSAEFKARVALEALKGLKTVHELASTSGVHPTQIAHWQHRLQKEMLAFTQPGSAIGQIAVEGIAHFTEIWPPGDAVGTASAGRDQ